MRQVFVCPFHALKVLIRLQAPWDPLQPFMFPGVPPDAGEATKRRTRAKCTLPEFGYEQCEDMQSKSAVLYFLLPLRARGTGPGKAAEVDLLQSRIFLTLIQHAKSLGLPRLFNRTIGYLSALMEGRWPWCACPQFAVVWFAVQRNDAPLFIRVLLECVTYLAGSNRGGKHGEKNSPARRAVAPDAQGPWVDTPNQPAFPSLTHARGLSPLLFNAQP